MLNMEIGNMKDGQDLVRVDGDKISSMLISFFPEDKECVKECLQLIRDLSKNQFDRIFNKEGVVNRKTYIGGKK